MSGPAREHPEKERAENRARTAGGAGTALSTREMRAVVRRRERHEDVFRRHTTSAHATFAAALAATFAAALEAALAAAFAAALEADFDMVIHPILCVFGNWLPRPSPVLRAPVAH